MKDKPCEKRCPKCGSNYLSLFFCEADYILGYPKRSMYRKSTLSNISMENAFGNYVINRDVILYKCRCCGYDFYSEPLT